MSLNDFYAGAAAIAGIIIFAKFVTHTRSEDRGKEGWKELHVTCIVAAWIALGLSLAILSGLPKSTQWPSNNAGGWARVVVFLAVLAAASILALDVGWRGKG